MAWKDMICCCSFPNFRGLFQPARINVVEIGAHTIMSHGVSVSRTHRHDWLILILLVAIEIGLNVIHPFYRFVSEDMMVDLKYPMKQNTIPVWSVPIYAVILPIIIFLIIYFRRRDVYDLHHSILGLLFAVLITGVLTDAIKDGVGRPRPNFFWRCFPDGIDKYDVWGNVECHGNASEIKEGHKSFPSGHTAWSFAGLGFLSMYLAGKTQAFNGRGHVSKLCIVVLPLLAACMVGVSRVDDYWHHWQDVFAGGLLGYVTAVFCYLQFFPPPYHHEGWGPYAYFRALEETRATSQLHYPVNGVNGESVDGRAVNHLSRRHSIADDRQSSLPTDADIESGRRILVMKLLMP